MTSFADISQQVDRFEQLLQSHGIQIRNRSDLEYGCLLLKQLLDDQRRAISGERIAPSPGFRDELQLALGVLNIIQLVLENATHADFGALFPHLRLLGDGNPAQTTTSSPRDQIANKLFELRLALATLRSGTGLLLDDPVNSSDGANPDILCVMRDHRRWGLACKVVHGDSPMSLFERIAEGVEQIERSNADIGMVVISLRNKLAHNELLPIVPGRSEETAYGVLPYWEIAQQALSETFRSRIAEMVQHVGRAAITEAFRGKKALACVTCPLETVSIIRTQHGRRPHFVASCTPTHLKKVQLALTNRLWPFLQT